MFCNKCGAEVSANATVCPRCGGQVAVAAAAQGNAVVVPNHMVGAILTTLFCCVVGGIVSIVYASKVNSKLAQGDIAGAQSASKTAMGWIIANIIFGLLIPVMGILMGALFPAISSATANAQTASAAMKGRRLYGSIIGANIDREVAGQPTVWPRTPGSSLLDGGRGNISGMGFDNATDYFKVLFDMKSFGKADWNPYVSDVDPDVLKLSNDDSRFCDWIVAANVSDELSDNVPVLISANVDPNDLKTSYDGGGHTPIPFGSSVGRTGIPWGDKAVVVIRKGGASQIFKKRQFTYDALYNGQSFFAPGLKYLDVK